MPATDASSLVAAPKRVSSQLRSKPSAQLTTEEMALASAGYVPPSQQANLELRHQNILQHFPTALGVDDFMARLEVALSGYGFTGENSIACTNLCRDEVTVPLKDKIESVFGGSFNTNGLGGVLTCGVTGIGAGLSHSPISDGKEHYVFFAFPHIAINSSGEVGVIARPGRPNKSCACGALAKCLGELKTEGYESNCKVPGVHDPLDPEYSILKQRLARRARYEKLDVESLDLVKITKLAERTISTDMRYLAEKVVDTRKANYAVVTGVQIHNWATELTPESGIPSLEFVAVAECYVVMDGVVTHMDVSKVPPLAPRQLQIMARASITAPKTYYDADVPLIGKTTNGTLKEVPLRYLTQRLGVTRDPEDLQEGQPQKSGWVHALHVAAPETDANVPTMLSHDYSSFEVYHPATAAALVLTPRSSVRGSLPVTVFGKAPASTEEVSELPAPPSPTTGSGASSPTVKDKQAQTLAATPEAEAEAASPEIQKARAESAPPSPPPEPAEPPQCGCLPWSRA